MRLKQCQQARNADQEVQLTTQDNTQSVLFPELFSKPVFAQFDQAHGSSDGGAILLKGADEQLQLTERLAACLKDRRQTGKVEHSLVDLLRQRVYGLALGYADCNDADRLADDPIQKLLLDRDPVEGDRLGSQPSLSRFENGVSRKELLRMGEELADVVIEEHAERLNHQARLITVDLDATDDPTHGQQQLTFFNGHYGSWCYLPLVGTLQFNQEAEQYVFTTVLRAGNAAPAQGAIALLGRVLLRLRRAFPRATLRVRLDAGFATPEIFEFLEAAGVEYVVAMGANTCLLELAQKALALARLKSALRGKTEAVYTELRYRAGTWPHRRRVILKAEVVRDGIHAPRNNPRFVVTNLRFRPETVYRHYRRRGQTENHIKELHHGLEVDRTSCSSFWANQFRVLMTTAAYVLLQQLRRAAAGTELARAQVITLRERLLKLGVWVKRSVRRLVLHLPQQYPWLSCWKRIATALGATS